MHVLQRCACDRTPACTDSGAAYTSCLTGLSKRKLHVHIEAGSAIVIYITYAL